MVVCRICGLSKPEQDFKHIHHFTKYKKHNVSWCKECQKMWMSMQKEKEQVQKKEVLSLQTEKFIVSFE